MTRMNIILGTMTFGKTPMSRITDLNTIESIVNLFASYGYKELDTARKYCDGTTEEVLADIRAPDIFQIATKVAPTEPGNHRREKLKAIFHESLQALKIDKVDILYLHAPDHSTPIEDTLRGVQDLYEQGLFERFGLSNYASWQVSAICEITTRNGWVKPSVYQGMYNALTRDVEHELFPCLRHYKIAFYAYNPLAGGILTKRYQDGPSTTAEQKSRFDPDTKQGKEYRARYWKNNYFDAIAQVHKVCADHGLDVADVALRWLVHHSYLRDDQGDGIIIGTSSVEHTEQNLKAVEKGPLPEAVVRVLNEAWTIASVQCPSYYR